MSTTSFASRTPNPAVTTLRVPAESAVLAAWRDREITARPVDAADLGTVARPQVPGTGPSVITRCSHHNSMTQPMGASPAVAGGAYAAKQAAPPRGRYR